jgi:toxin ParE1/3/4
MPRVVRSSDAAADLAEIWFYIARNNRAAADAFIDQVAEKFYTLAAFPHIGRPRPEFGPGLRSFPIGRYIIFYRPMDEGIEVIRVLHGARDIESLF